MSRKRRVAIVFTGGTIASNFDREWGGVVPVLSGREILDRMTDVAESVDLTVHEYGTYPGPHIGPANMLEIAAIVRGWLASDDIDGVVVTHGTDTLEETAYFLDCTIASTKPVVVVGAMRNASEPDWDGPRNLRDGIQVAASPEATGIGVLVCLGGVVTAASETTKTDTEDLGTFQSSDFGPLGRVTNGYPLLHRRPLHREVFATEGLPGTVPLFKSYAGMDGDLIRMAVDAGAAGIVVEAFGVGNVTPPTFYACVDAVARGLPVVLVSRCPVGRLEYTYAYEGAGRHLHEAGVIFADYLNGQKARIKLLCALGAGLSVEQLRSSFEWVRTRSGRTV